MLLLLLLFFLFLLLLLVLFLLLLLVGVVLLFLFAIFEIPKLQEQAILSCFFFLAMKLRWMLYPGRSPCRLFAKVPGLTAVNTAYDYTRS